MSRNESENVLHENGKLCNESISFARDIKLRFFFAFFMNEGLFTVCDVVGCPTLIIKSFDLVFFSSIVSGRLLSFLFWVTIKWTLMQKYRCFIPLLQIISWTALSLVVQKNSIYSIYSTFAIFFFGIVLLVAVIMLGIRTFVSAQYWAGSAA